MAEHESQSGLVNARIVFWGIDGCGKTSNLQAIYAKLRPDHRGEMRSVPTPLDPSATFEELPIELGEIAGVRTQIQLVTVPGGPEQAPTRKRILDEVDGVVLVIDAQRERVEENVACVRELREFLADYGRTLGDLPLVAQYNKRDLADPYFMDELHRRLDLGDTTVFEAVATEPTGVLQTLSTISKRVIRTLRESGETQKPAAEPTVAAAAAAAAEPATEVYRAAPETAGIEMESPFSDPSLSESPAADLAPGAPSTDDGPASPGPGGEESVAERMEAAILREAEDAERGSIDAVARQAESLLEPTWDRVTAELQSPDAVRIEPGLSVVSVGEATRAGDRAVKVPLVLGDSSGNTSTLILTIQLDPVMDET
jgi:signal recognition particle receptor subunit beta